MNNAYINLSELDTKRFGIVSARANIVSAENLPEINAFCRSQQVKFLIARTSSSDIKAVHSMEADGFRLMDTLVYLQNNIKSFIPELILQDFTIQALDISRVSEIIEVARESFTGYQGHYHVDPRLDPLLATEVYTSWAERCCTDGLVANHVITAMVKDRVVGFKSMRLNNSEQAEFVLAGVLSEMRGRGIYNALATEGLRWCKAAGATQVLTSTLLTNKAVQNASTRLGFRAFKSYHTFHKWFD